MIRIESGETSAVVAPQIGGSIISFRIGDHPILRTGDPESSDPLRQASFSLLPWCNRIENGRIRIGGDEIVLSPNYNTESHAIHGHGWMSRWTVEEELPSSVALSLVHPADSWPWRYTAVQRISVEDRRLQVEVWVTNRSDRPMPASLGFHPYFERPGRVTATVDGIWEVDDRTLPTVWASAESFRAADVDTAVHDNTFTGWDGKAILDTAAGRLELSSDLPDLHVYTPRGRSVFCLEPVGAAADAVNHPERGGVMLEPGETTAAWMRLTVGA